VQGLGCRAEALCAIKGSGCDRAHFGVDPTEVTIHTLFTVMSTLDPGTSDPRSSGIIASLVGVS
jgi:hypothetical protein